MRYLPFLAFFLSGASGLVFQTIWSRLLHHVFGSSSVAISSVVSAFMGGLALGAWLFGRFADRLRRPLLVYAGAEAGVGLIGLLVPWLVDSRGFLASVNGWLRMQLDADSGEFMLARFLCIFPILVVPTTLMGATLPLLCRHFVPAEADGARASQQVGRLYAINTIGAVFGVFMAAFVLMPGIGVTATNAIACATNLALAVGITLLRGPLERLRGVQASAPGPGESARVAPEATATPTAPPDEPAWPDRVRYAAAVAFALSGAVALLCEVVWSRALVNTVGASVYAFAIILMTFLIGIAGGSAAASALLSRRGVDDSRGLLLAATALVAVASGPVWIHAGTLVAAGCVALGTGLITTVDRLRARERRLASEVDSALVPVQTESDGRLLQMLAVPCALSLLVATVYGDRLAGMALTVVGLMALLLLMLLRGRARSVLLLAGLQFFIATATFASDLWADELSIAFASTVAPLYDDLPNHVGTVMASMSLTAGLCVLPAACGMGAMFPLTIRIWSRGGQQVGRDVGTVYTGNTLGSIVGAWLPGFVLMPAFGMQGTLHVGIALNLILGTAVMLAAAERSGASPEQPRGAARHSVGRRTALAAALIVPGLVAALYLGSATRAPLLTWNISKMTLGAFRISLARDVLDEEAWGAPELVYHRDGLSTTVTVERWGRHYSLKNNGKVDASNGDDMPTQIMVAALPLLFHARGPADLDVAIIGVGSGVTVGAALQFPVRSVEAVELERAVVEASRFFGPVNHLRYDQPEFPYLSAPRLSVRNDDGRNFLASSQKRYDVIVSEPSNPWLTGVSDLFTREHFQVSREKLAPGGVYCQWVQLYELSPENVKVIYRTFATHFKHVRVFSAEDLSSDTILVGSDSPLTLDLARLQRVMADPRARAELERAYVHAPQDVFARMLLASRDEVMRYTQVEARREGERFVSRPAADNSEPCPPATCRRRPSPINTDDNALIEFAAPRDLIGFERYKGYLRSMYAADWPYGRFADELAGIGQGAVASGNLARQARSLIAHGRKREARAVLTRASSFGPSPALSDVQAMLEALASPQPALPPVIPAQLPSAVADVEPALQDVLSGALGEVRRLAARKDWKAAFANLEAVPELLREQAGATVLLLYADLAHRAGQHALTIDTLEALVRHSPGVAVDRPDLHFYLARAHDALDHYDKAVRNMQVYLDARQALSLAPPRGEDAYDAGNPPETNAPGISPKTFRNPETGRM